MGRLIVLTSCAMLTFMSLNFLRDSAPSSPATQPKPPAPSPHRFAWRVIIPFAVLMAAATLGVLTLLIVLLGADAPATPVTIVIDGEARQTDTNAQTVAELLRDFQIDPNSGDQIDPPPLSPITPDMVVRIDRARSVSLLVDGEARVLWTPLTNPAQILASAGVTVEAGDLVLLDGSPADVNMLAGWPVPVTQIAVRHVMPIIVVDEEDGSTRVLMTTRETVGEALFDAGYTLYEADSLSVALSEPVVRDMMVTIRRANPINIVVDGETIRTRVRGSTVADALASAGVTLTGLDYPIPAESTPLIPGMSIRVIRVQEEIVETDRTLAYETLYQADPELEIDNQRVLQPGREGIERTRIRVRYENGIEVSRTVESVEVIQAPQNHIIGYGTNIVIRTLETPDGVIEYWRVIRMYATSYHPAALGGDNITATGRTLVKGIVGGDPRITPYGTRIYVFGYGFGDIQDTGGPRRIRLWVDLGYSDEDFVGWSRNTDVYILTPVPPPEDILYILPCCALQ